MLSSMGDRRRRGAGGGALGAIGIGVTILFWVYKPGGYGVAIGATVIAATLIASGLCILVWDTGPMLRLRIAIAPVQVSEYALRESESKRAEEERLLVALRAIHRDIEDMYRRLEWSKGWGGSQPFPLGAWVKYRDFLRGRKGIAVLLDRLESAYKAAATLNEAQPWVSRDADKASPVNWFAAHYAFNRARLVLRAKLRELDPSASAPRSRRRSKRDPSPQPPSPGSEGRD